MSKDFKCVLFSVDNLIAVENLKYCIFWTVSHTFFSRITAHVTYTLATHMRYFTVSRLLLARVTHLNIIMQPLKM